MGNIKRIILKEGWWDIDTDPPWGKIRELKGANDDSSLLEKISVAWSFKEAISVESINSRNMSDVLAVLEEVAVTVLPLFGRLATTLSRSSIKPSGEGM